MRCTNIKEFFIVSGKVTTLSRSSSTITDQSVSTGTSGLFIDSFAQTEESTSPIMGSSSTKACSSQDMVDSIAVEHQKNTYKERNISITDDEDATHSGSASGSVDVADQDRLRYQSVCEEDEESLQPDSVNSNTTVNFYL